MFLFGCGRGEAEAALGNLLGPLHYASDRPGWVSPVHFRSDGADWTDDYVTVPYGLMGQVRLDLYD